MSLYLDPFDIAASGTPDATPQQVQQASAIIDGFLSRPEGLVYATDSRGAPCYMVGAYPSGSLTLATAISPGANVTAVVTGWVTPDLIGEVVIADRAAPQGQPSLAEALVVTAVAGQTVTFGSVLGAHAAGALLETGLVLLEERRLPSRRPITRVSRGPIVRLLSGQGRFGLGRRSQQFSGISQELWLLRSLTQFGATPQWLPFDVTQASVSPATDEVWIPSSIYLADFSEVRLRYVAGYPAPPPPVKAACAALVQSVTDFPELASNVLQLQAGGTTIKKAAATLMTPDVLAMLAPFDAHLFY